MQGRILESLFLEDGMRTKTYRRFGDSRRLEGSQDTVAWKARTTEHSRRKGLVSPVEGCWEVGVPQGRGDSFQSDEEHAVETFVRGFHRAEAASSRVGSDCRKRKLLQDDSWRKGRENWKGSQEV